jgi:predicted outer membrane repeat protein
MRWLVGVVLLLLALGTLRVVGCGETTGTGGDGGSGGDGGAGGDGGHGGGTVACEGNVCPCTEAGIRAAIEAGGNDPYTFECGDGMTVVTQAQIVIDNDVTLDGGGMLTIDGDDAHRVLYVPTGITAELRGITITGGVGLPIPSHVPPYEFERGGGIYSEGTLTLDNCVVSGNYSEEFGGGIGMSGVLTLINSIVSENTAGVSGGISGGGTLVMTNSKVVDNRANRSNGGIGLCGWITMTRSAVSDNTAAERAGGIFQNCHERSIIMVESTISGNTAGGIGGGIVTSGPLTLTNSTVSGNTAGDIGGGIYKYGAMTLLTNSTVSYNTAVGGGGIYSQATLTLRSSTISGNIATGAIGGGAILNQGGRVESSMATLIDGDCSTTSDQFLTSRGYNIESPGDTCGFDQPTDRPETTATELNLGELADNGGPTRTHALLTEPVVSVAIDWIPAYWCEVETDQRGEPRPETGGDACDVGAFERQPDDPEP